MRWRFHWLIYVAFVVVAGFSNYIVVRIVRNYGLSYTEGLLTTAFVAAVVTILFFYLAGKVGGRATNTD
jgi:hypothetical protein